MSHHESNDCDAKRNWVVSQLGAREHYAIPRALHAAGRLERLIVDYWCPPGSIVRKFDAFARLHDRWHDDLSDARIAAPRTSFFAEEASARSRRMTGWERILHRNDWYQSFAISRLKELDDSRRTLFSYSYTARRVLGVAKQRGWPSIVDQIDPGPEEQRIVACEHQRYSHVTSRWQPAPDGYWDQWREEMAICDRIVVNSPWTAQCLQTESIDESKIDIVPLVYSPCERAQRVHGGDGTHQSEKTRVLFLGQVNLRKGVGRLIDAMRLLSADSRFELILAGPTEIDPSFWASMANVKYVGPLRRSDVAATYQNADVFILPTLSDGYALTQLEALSFGLPVIASRHCGPAVTDGVNGLILPDLEPDTIASTLVKFTESGISGAISGPTFDLNALGNQLLKLAATANEGGVRTDTTEITA